MTCAPTKGAFVQHCWQPRQVWNRGLRWWQAVSLWLCELRVQLPSADFAVSFRKTVLAVKLIKNSAQETVLHVESMGSATVNDTICVLPRQAEWYLLVKYWGATMYHSVMQQRFSQYLKMANRHVFVERCTSESKVLHASLICQRLADQGKDCKGQEDKNAPRNSTLRSSNEGEAGLHSIYHSKRKSKQLSHTQNKSRIQTNLWSCGNMFHSVLRNRHGKGDAGSHKQANTLTRNL